MKRILLILTTLAIIFTFGLTILVPSGASAAGPTNVSECYKGFLGFPNWFKYMDVEIVADRFGDTTCQITGPKVAGGERLDVGRTATRVVLAVIEILLRVGGLVALVFIIYAGFQFVLSSGDTSKEVAARNTIINAVIGMLITIFAIAIVTFVGRSLST